MRSPLSKPCSNHAGGEGPLIEELRAEVRNSGHALVFQIPSEGGFVVTV